MLTLIEPPGAKRAVPTANSRSAQHLLNFAAATDDDDEVDADDAAEGGAIERTGAPSLAQRIDNFLVGRSNSYGYSERWKREFSERPSWCDADMTLQQIKRGKARGNRLALYSRSLIQKALFALGSFVERHSFLVIALVLTFFTFCCYGLQFVRIETDIVKLWVARGGRLDEELSFLARVQQHNIGTKIKRENGLGGGYQVVIHTPPSEGNNILTKEGLLEHVAIMQQIAQYRIEVAGENWTLSDICFKPPSPEIDNSSMAARYASIIDRIIPCIWITPIDCFWEGSKAIGPHPNIEARSLGIAKEFLTSLPPKERFSWSDLDPQAIVDELDELFSLGNTRSFFHRADIGKGYLDRWCIDPLDAECPRYAPNYFPFCDLIPRFLDYAKRSDFEVPIDPQYLKDEEEKMKRENNQFNLFDFFGGKKKRDVDRIRRTSEQANPVSLGGETHSDSLASSITSSVNDKASMAEVPTSDVVPDVTGLPEDELKNPSPRTPVADKLNSSSIASSDAAATTEHPEAARRKAEREKGDRAASDEPQRGVVEQNHSEWSSAHALSDLDDLYSEEEEETILNVTLCKKYARPMADWMKQNREKWSEFLSKTEFPVTPDYGKVVYGGCRGFAKGVMSWPQDLIIGGARQGDKKLKSAEAFQSVFLVASPNDVFLRFKDGERRHLKPHLNANLWNVTVAEEVIRTWQRNFTHNLYNHEWNFERDANGDIKKEYRRVHPLASTSIADMLEEFCQFNYTIILIGYVLMLAYALHSQMRRHGCMLSADSCMGLAFAGVLTVTFASVAGLGLATWFGIEFNAATTQIVPFLTLGIGVDNMFLLLHNYHAVVDNIKTDEVGMLMKETGMSILMTSINNILSFLAGTLLPIPALRGFCAQSSILLTFNLLAILTIYPAIISLDLRRRKNARRDVCCCVVANELLVADDDYAVGIGVKPHVQEKRTVGDLVPSYHNLYSRNDREDDVEDDVKPWTLHAFLRHYYIPFLKQGTTKAVILFVCGCMLLAALIGIHRASYGLELSDVLPEHTAPAAFLKARDRYFSFYPMFAVLKGPNIDYARDQHKIDNYRRSIGRSRFVVKVDGGEPSEKYWLSLMRAWLRSLQIELDRAIAMGQINVTNGAIVDETGSSRKLSAAAVIAYRLTCSYGNMYNCSGRIGKMRLIDESGTINVDGFYNYVTGWYNSDSMMYHVSQASFFPAPPVWSYENSSALLVPPAEPFAYSQIPFYLTGLTDTPVIIEMIKEIRAVCDQFAKEGLPNFPSGIAFTFWEQYLHLSRNLLQAICVIAFAVFFVISLIICNPWAAGVIMVILILMTVELAGFLGLTGIKLNPVSAVTIITAVGIGVEFTAHVVLAFLTSLGTREVRMAAAVDRVFVPVIHGALSTLLGIIMLAFSEFEFVVKYFFVVMTALIAIGIVNGLALLPVLLSLVGPPCEVSPVDGSDRLPPPPALRRSRNKRLLQEMQTHRRNDSDDSNTGTLGPENCSTMLLIEPPRDGSSGPGPRLVVNTHARSASAHIAT